MNIPHSSLDPFGITGMPPIRIPIMYRYANRQLDVCIARMENWLYFGSADELSDEQIELHMIDDLLHDGRDEWLTVNVKSNFTTNGTIVLQLVHLKQPVYRDVLISKPEKMVC